MSIWSRNPKDVAKLARTLQGNTDKQRHTGEDSQGPQRARRPRSLSPRALEKTGMMPYLSTKPSVEKFRSMSVERQKLQLSERPASVNSPVSDTVDTEMQTQETRVLTTPKLMVTDEEGSSFDALELLEPSSDYSGISDSSTKICQPTTSSDSTSVTHKKNEKPAEDKSLLHKSSCHGSVSSGLNGNSSVSTTDTKSLQAETKREMYQEEKGMLENKESVNVIRIKKEDTTRNESPEMVSYQNLSTDMNRLSPRLAARSPELLRKLKEVTSTISSKKAKRGDRLLSTPGIQRGPSSPQNINRLCTPVENRRPVSPQNMSPSANGVSGTRGILVTPVLKCDVLSEQNPGSLDGSEGIIFVNAESLLDNKEISSFLNLEEEAAPCPSTGQKFTAQVCNQVAVKPVAIRIDANRPQSGFQKFAKPTLTSPPEDGSPHGRERPQRERVITTSYQNNQPSSTAHEQEEQDGHTIQHRTVNQETDDDERQCALCHGMRMAETLELKNSLGSTCAHRRQTNLRSPKSRPFEPNTATRDHINYKESEAISGKENAVSCSESTKCSQLVHCHMKHGTAGHDHRSECSSVVTVVPMHLNGTEYHQEEETASEDTFSSFQSDTKMSLSLCETSDTRAMSPAPHNNFVSLSACSEKSTALSSASNAPLSPSGYSEGGSKSLPPNRKQFRDEKSSQRSINLSANSPHSPCPSSSGESFLSLLETGSDSDDSSSMLMNYVMSSSHKHGLEEHSINRRRLRKMVRVLRQYNQFLSLSDADPNDTTNTVSELKHLCLSLSKKLEHEHQQQFMQQHQHHKVQQKEETLQKQQPQIRNEQGVHEQYRTNRVWQDKGRSSNDRRGDGYHAQIRHHHLRQLHEKQVLHPQQQQKQKPPKQSPHRQESAQKGHRQTFTRQQTEFSGKLPPESQRSHREIVRPTSKSTPTGNVSKSHTPGPESTKKSTFTKKLHTAVDDSDQTVLEKACQNTPLLDLLGVDKDLLDTDQEDETELPQHPQVHDNQRIRNPRHGRELRNKKGEGKGNEKGNVHQLQTEKRLEDFSDIDSVDFVGREEEEEKEDDKDKEGDARDWQAKLKSEAVKLQSPDKEQMRLDEEFGRLMITVKAHVLKLPQESDQRRLFVWIRKLSASPASSVADKKKRNMRCKQLLDTLSKGRLQRTASGNIPEHGQIVEHTRRTEAKYREKLQRLRHDHDSALQKILEQKNCEVENVKREQLNRIKTMEQTVHKLQTKVETLTKSLESVRQAKDKQISELEGENGCDIQQSVYEQLVQDLEGVFAEETWHLETDHAVELDRLSQDTDTRLQRLEGRYVRQTEESVQVMEDLSSRLQGLQGEVLEARSTCSAQRQDKEQLQQRLVTLTDHLHAQRQRTGQLQKRQQQQQESVDHQMKMLSQDADVYLQLLTHQHTSAAAQASETISELQHRVSSLRKTIADTEQDWSRQVKEREFAHEEGKRHLTQLHAEQMDCIKNEATVLQNQMMSKLPRLEKRLRDTEEELQKQTAINKEQVLAAEKAREEYQRYTEGEQVLRIASLRKQLDQMEAEAVKSKEAVEEESKDFAQRMEQQQLEHQAKVREVKDRREQDKARALQAVETARSQARGERQGKADRWQQHCLTELENVQRDQEQRQQNTMKMAEELMTEVSELAEELERMEERRKEEVEELQQLWKEERLSMEQHYKEQIAQCRLEMDVQCLELQKTHWTDKGMILERLLHVLSNDKLDNAQKELHRAEYEARDISIPSLKSRVNRLQQKADMLQAELTLPIRFSPDWIKFP